MYTAPHNYSFRNRDFNSTPRLTPNTNAVLTDAPCRLDEDWEIIATFYTDAASAEARLIRYCTGDLVRFLNDAFDLCLRLRRVEDFSGTGVRRRKRFF